MANWFTDLTKLLADEKLPRRAALARIGGIAAGAVLASFLPAEAYAAKRQACKLPMTCSDPGFYPCGSNPNCFCGQKKNLAGACVCNSYCSSLKSCTRQIQCPSGYTCITSTGCSCTSGICVKNCTKTCQLDSNHSGRTAASLIHA